MSRSAGDIHAEQISLLPTGWIWPREDSLLGAVLQPAAVMLSEIEATAEAMMDQIDPRTATHTLPDFERVIGPDLCGRDTSTMTTAERQELAHQRWTARGGQSRDYFIALAARRGVTIEIEETRLTRVGIAVAGDELINHPQEFVWLIKLSLGSWKVARAGESVAGDLLYEFDLSDIECDIRRAKPGQTDVYFRYLE